MTTDLEEGQDLVTDAVSIPPQESIPPLVNKRFRPWHRLRKHYVRLHQWAKHARALVQARKEEFANRPLHYLGLPGDDLLDLRVILGAIEPHGVRLRYLGFNSSGTTTEASLSETEVNASEQVDDAKSRVLTDRFENIGVKNSLARRRVRELAPFDVVNLDLCGSAVPAPPSDRSVFSAIAHVLELQQERQGSSWLLFITTRADQQSADAESLRGLVGCIVGNATAHAAFASEIETRLGLPSAALESVTELSPDVFARTVGLGIGKWLLQAINGVSQVWDVELLDENFWYSVKGRGPDMLSLSFRFSRKPSVVDRSGLTPPQGSPAARSELALALALVKQMANLEDPDEILLRDEQVRQKITKKARDLLVSARYDGDAYLAWLAAGHPSDSDGPETDF